MASSKRPLRLFFVVLAVLVVLALIYTWFNMTSTDVADDETDMPLQEDDTGARAMPDGEAAASMTYAAYGERVAAEGAVSVQDLAAQPASHLGQTVKVAGPARSVCQKKGCWVALGEAPATVRVHVPRTDSGYAFTLPKDLAGERVVAEGVLTEKTLDTKTQDHYARESNDAAASATELHLAARSVLVAEAP